MGKSLMEQISDAWGRMQLARRTVKDCRRQVRILEDEILAAQMDFHNAEQDYNVLTGHGPPPDDVPVIDPVASSLKNWPEKG